MKDTTPNDLIVQFAILWGETIGGAYTGFECMRAKEMKKYDSQELLYLFNDWANEYMRSSNDVNDFFNNKLDNLLTSASS